MVPSARAVALCCELKHAIGAHEHRLLLTLSASLSRLKDVCPAEDRIVRMEWFSVPALCGNAFAPKTCSGLRLPACDDTQGVCLRSTWVSGCAASLSMAQSLCCSN